MVKNIAYATEEETLMGNGVNLRTLTNDGGSAVISDYGAHLLRLSLIHISEPTRH